MLKKYLTPEIFFCLAMFVGMPICVSYRLLDPFISPRVILVAASVAVLTIVMIFRKSENASLLKSIPVISLGAFLLLYALSITKSLNPGDAWYEWLKTFLGLPVMLLTAVLFREQANRIIMLKFSQVTALLLSCIYFFQWFKLAFNPSLDKVFDYSLHVASTLGNKNFYAELVCLLLVFSVISFFTFKKFFKYLSLVNILLLVISIFTVRSMAAVVAVLMAALIAGTAIYYGRLVKKISALKIVAMIAATILIGGIILFQTGAMKNFSARIEVVNKYLSNPSLADSTARSNNNSTFERILLWRNTLGLIQEYPLSGCGAGNWKLLYPKYGISGTRYIETGATHYEHPHNDYLLMASEAGLPAAVAFILFLTSIAWVSFRKIRSQNDQLWYAGILFAVICFAVTSMFSFPRVRFYAWIQLSVFAGMYFALTENENAFQKKSLQSVWKIILIASGIISVWAIVAGTIRYQGELHSKLLQVAKKQKNFARIVRESERASSWYFPVDETATPFTWYKGMALFYSGQVAAAKAAYEDAFEKNPYHIQLLNDLATTLEQSDERERAIQIYQRALSITPYFPHSLLNISACYFNVGKRDSAYVYIDKLYGIRLTYQEKKSYTTYLPAILREKIYADSTSYPEDVRQQAMLLATDTAFVSKIYRNSKLRGLDFTQALTDSLRN